MKPTELKQTIKLLYKTKRPGFIWGLPGIGKSSIMNQVAEELGIGLIDIRALLRNPVDFRGIPAVDREKWLTKWVRPEELPKEGKGIIFLDELPSAPPLVQAACYQLVLENRVGEHEIGKGWIAFGAGNRETDRAVTHIMPSPLANRFVHLELEFNLQDWIAWALKNDMPMEIISYARYRPNNICVEEVPNKKAFPTPRTWEYVGDILKERPPLEIRYELIKGCVGEGIATDFEGFLRLHEKMPDPDLVIADPDGIEIPTDPKEKGIIYALCGALVPRATKNTVKRIIRFADRLEKQIQGGMEFSVALMFDIMKRQKELVNDENVIRWVSRHSDVIL